MDAYGNQRQQQHPYPIPAYDSQLPTQQTQPPFQPTYARSQLTGGLSSNPNNRMPNRPASPRTLLALSNPSYPFQSQPSSQSSHNPQPQASHPRYGLSHPSDRYSGESTDSVLPDGTGVLMLSGTQGNAALMNHSRKRPKYTRSKTGCLTCRVKKIKCDETRPKCSRCQHGQRECTWPAEAAPSKSSNPKSGSKNSPKEKTSKGPNQTQNQLGNDHYGGHLELPTHNRLPYQTHSHSRSEEYSSGGESSNFSRDSPEGPGSRDPSDLGDNDFRGGLNSVEGLPQFDEFQLGGWDSDGLPSLPMSSLPYPLSATSSAANSPTYLIPNNQNFYPSSNAPPHTGLSAPLEPSPASTLSSTPTNTYGIAPDGLNVDNNFDFGEFAGDGLDLPPIPLSQQPTYSQYAPNYNLSLSIPHGTTDYGGTPSPPGLARSMNTSASSSVASTPAPHHSRDTQSPRPRSWPPSSSIPVQPSPVLSPDPIEPYFNTISERNLIRHYCEYSTHLIMALPDQDPAMSLNPVLACMLPIVLSVHPRENPAVEALRLSLLGLGAIHKAFLYSRSSASNALGLSTLAEQSNTMMQLAMALRRDATVWLAQSCETYEGPLSDAALGASMSIALIDIFAGGRNYGPNLEFAKNLVSIRGGPAAILASSSKTQRVTAGGSVSPGRLLLEILTVYETFGSLTSGEEPTLLGHGNTDWWFDGDISTYHFFSVEKMFGVSRKIIAQVARVSSLLSRNAKYEAIPASLRLIEDPPPLEADPVLFSLHTGAKDLWFELKTGTVKTISTDLPRIVVVGEEDESSIVSELEEERELVKHPRLESGNNAYRRTLQIIILRDLFHVPREDPRVQTFTQAILDWCLDSTRNLGMAVDLTWPAIIAGCNADIAQRPDVTEIFERFRKQCCFDIDTAEQIVTEVWDRTDNGFPDADWRSVVEDCDLHVLLV